MLILYGLTAVVLAASLAANPGKTARALQIALRRFLSMAPGFALMLMLVVVTFQLLPDHTIVHLLARENRWSALAGALGLGSVSIMPGFVAFPLCAIMLDRGALYMVLSAFSTSLMMVGVVTFPIEKAYLGTRLALARNGVSLAIAIAVAIATGLVFGELR
jgi:hypothetical protein